MDDVGCCKFNFDSLNILHILCTYKSQRFALFSLSIILQYIDPDYAGGEYDEYFGDNAEGSLDCQGQPKLQKLGQIGSN